MDIGLSHVKIHSMETNINKSDFEPPVRPSFRRHQQQRFWQILTPVVLGGLITLGAAVLMVLALTETVTGINLSQAADTSLIWLILPVMMFGIVFTAILIGLIYAAAKALKILPHYTYLGQHYADLIATKIKFFAGKIAAPIITTDSIGAGVGAFFSRLFGRSHQ